MDQPPAPEQVGIFVPDVLYPDEIGEHELLLVRIGAVVQEQRPDRDPNPIGHPVEEFVCIHMER